MLIKNGFKSFCSYKYKVLNVDQNVYEYMFILQSSTIFSGGFKRGG